MKTEQLLMERQVRRAYDQRVGNDVLYYSQFKDSLLDDIIDKTIRDDT